MLRSSTLVAVLLGAFVVAPLHAQGAADARVGRRSPRWSIAAGVTGAETVLREGSGLLVRGNTSGYVGADALWRVAPSMRLPLFAGAFARGGQRRVTVRVPDFGGRAGYGVGHLVETTVGARGELVFLDPFSVRAGLGLTYARGPRDVRPFDVGSVHPAAEVGVALRAGVRSRWSLELRAAAYRIGTSSAVQQAGAVRTTHFELRRDF